MRNSSRYSLFHSALALLLLLSFTFTTTRAKLPADLVNHILHGSHKAHLPLGVVDKGVVYRGAGWRLRRFVSSLLAGKTVKVGVIGGSVSWGHGASSRGNTDWFSVFVSWLRLAFPKATVHARNGCIPGTGTQLTLYCMEETLEADVDLVFEEFATNDGFYNEMVEPRTLAQERLMRKMLAFANRPAVVVMSFLQPCHAARPKDHQYAMPQCQFYQSPEDQFSMVAQYYDVSVLSFRNMIWHVASRSYAANVSGLRWEDWMIDDLKHPNDLGFKMMADLAIRLIQRVIMEMSFRPYSHEDERHALHEPLPPPMFSNNYAPSTRCCAYQDELKKYVVSHDGWEWVNEGTEEKPKKGYVTNQLGAAVLMRAPIPSAADASGGAMVFVTYLRSYTPMGAALMSCEGGCRCEAALVDAHNTESPTSQSFLAKLLVQSNGQQGDCLIRVATQPSSHGTKFKVAGLLVVLEVFAEWQKLGFDFEAPFEVFEQGDGTIPLKPPG